MASGTSGSQPVSNSSVGMTTSPPEPPVPPSPPTPPVPPVPPVPAVPPEPPAPPSEGESAHANQSAAKRSHQTDRIRLMRPYLSEWVPIDVGKSRHLLERHRPAGPGTVLAPVRDHAHVAGPDHRL